uniref:protein JTB isoform X2 n=1 Tax=Myxine glutinosa TaxID=7769 RepID=UPI00358E4D94
MRPSCAVSDVTSALFRTFFCLCLAFAFLRNVISDAAPPLMTEKNTRLDIAAGSLSSKQPCWKMEEYQTVQTCSPCSDLQKKTLQECKATGFVEKLLCSHSEKEDYRSCRSRVVEERTFWYFEAAMLSTGLFFTLLVMLRQRQLDRMAADKVRRQFESV